MASEHIKLLRRPLPPKKLQPIRKSLAKTVLSDAMMESVPLGIRKSTEGNDWSSRDDPLWDSDLELSRTAPTPLSVRSPTPPATLPEITYSFPSRPWRTFSQSRLLDLLKDHPRYARPPPCFVLNDFLESARELAQPGQCLRKEVLSHCSYKKLVDLFISELHSGHQREVANLILSWEKLPQAKHRIPQNICELVALVQMELQAQKVCVRLGVDQHLYQTEENSVELWTPGKTQAEHIQHSMCPVNELILSSFPIKHFQGSCRSSSPFQPAAECVMISASELAILECLMLRNTALSLKAHFITRVPDLSPLIQSLLYLNLSFNNFTVFPVEVCELPRLEVLKLRDNPIEEIPAEIEKLLNLKTLVISFCKITTLPSQLYRLPALRHLDVSHNLISSLSDEIKNLRLLQYVNIEGNQLEGLPVGILGLSVSELRLGGNYTHPLLWTINSVNSPPSLLHAAAHSLAFIQPEQRYSTLPTAARLVLSRAGVCECCGGPRFGPGLKLIHPVYGLFGLSSVPILFLSCSASCYSRFRKQSHTLTQHLHTG
ncbi:hypothetical protein AOLI_G00080880 [Acnodon oligacanthus]